MTICMEYFKNVFVWKLKGVRCHRREIRGIENIGVHLEVSSSSTRGSNKDRIKEVIRECGKKEGMPQPEFIIYIGSRATARSVFMIGIRDRLATEARILFHS